MTDKCWIRIHSDEHQVTVLQQLKRLGVTDPGPSTLRPHKGALVLTLDTLEITHLEQDQLGWFFENPERRARYVEVTTDDLFNGTLRDWLDTRAKRLRVGSLAYELILLENTLKVGCQQLTFADARQVAQWILDNVPEET